MCKIMEYLAAEITLPKEIATEQKGLDIALAKNAELCTAVVREHVLKLKAMGEWEGRKDMLHNNAKKPWGICFFYRKDLLSVS